MNTEKSDIKLTESEKIKEQISEYLKDAYPNNIKYQAYIDWDLQDKLNRDLSKYRNQNNLNEIIKNDSNFKIIKDHLSSINQEINKKIIQIPGYYDVYFEIGYLFNELKITLSSEINSNYISLENEDKTDYSELLVNAFKVITRSEIYKTSTK